MVSDVSSRDECAWACGVSWRRIRPLSVCTRLYQVVSDMYLTMRIRAARRCVSHGIMMYHTYISFDVSEFRITHITSYHVVSSILYQRPVSQTSMLSHCDTAAFVIQEREGTAGDTEPKARDFISKYIRAYHKQRATPCVSHVSEHITLVSAEHISTHDMCDIG